MNKPNLFILGVQKCGTTTLTDAMRQHPEIFVPSVKETYYFCDESLYVKGDGWYMDEFYSSRSRTRKSIVVDGTPFYLASELGLERVVAFAGASARFIVLLRDPVARAYSAYWHQKRLGNEALSFREALEAEPERIAIAKAEGKRWWRHAYVEVGRYAKHLSRALSLIGRDRLLVLTERGLTQTANGVQRVSEHIGLSVPLTLANKRANVAGIPRLPWLQQAIIGDNWAKALARRVVPRELRSALGTRLLAINTSRIGYPPMSVEDQKRLADIFGPENIALRELNVVEPWCLPDLMQWSVF